MAYSYVNYTGDGSKVGPYSVPFPYISESHVHVYVNGVEASYTWLSTSTIELATAPALNDIIHVSRETARTARLVDFKNGSLLDEDTQNLDSKQLFYLYQEAMDLLVKAGDVDNAIFQDRQSVLDALIGNLDETMLSADLAARFEYADRWYEADNIIADCSDYVEPVYLHTPLQLGIAEIYVQKDRIDGFVSDVGGDFSIVSQMADEYFVKTNVDGHISGFGLVGGATSNFVVSADKFGIIKPDGTGSTYVPFIVDTTSGLVGIDGSLIVTGSISAGSLAADSVTADKIVADTLTATHFDGDAFGDLTISSGNLTLSGSNSLTISSGSEVSLSGGMSVEDGGDVTFHAGTSSFANGNIRWEDSSVLKGVLGMYATNSFYWVPRNSTISTLSIGSGSYPWYSAGIVASHGIYLEPNQGYSSQQGYAVEVSGNITPSSGHTTAQCGDSFDPWVKMYSHAALIVGDLFWMDERTEDGVVTAIDDVAVIKSIKPSPHVDSETGLRIINDSTLPKWLVHKHDRDGALIEKESGERTHTWKKGDVAVNRAGKPYLSTSTMLSLLMGAVRQLDNRIKTLEKEKHNG